MVQKLGANTMDQVTVMTAIGGIAIGGVVVLLLWEGLRLKHLRDQFWTDAVLSPEEDDRSMALAISDVPLGRVSSRRSSAWLMPDERNLQ